MLKCQAVDLLKISAFEGNIRTLTSAECVSGKFTELCTGTRHLYNQHQLI